MTMTQAIPERRAMRRFDMRLAAEVKLAGGSANEIATETRNVSARGVFFYLDCPLRVGDSLQVTLTFPPHLTLVDKVRVRFNARVVRVEERELPGAGIGIAAIVDNYEFLRNRPLAEIENSEEPDWKQ